MGDQIETDRERWLTQANSFGPAAAIYDRVRPRYPGAAIEWSLAPLGAGHWRVLDIGAGTGIMTRELLSYGHQVTAVEPDDLMRARLSTTTPDAVALAGRAESLPTPTGAADAAVAAQAYHWFDQERAHAELGRVIRPGGVFAAIWNFRDDSVDWVAEYSRIVDGHGGGHDGLSPAVSGSDIDMTSASFGEWFEPVEYAQFPHTSTLTPDGLVELLKSRSYFLTATPAGQARLESDIRGLAGDHPSLAGRAEFTLPYITLVHRAIRVTRS